MAADGVLIGLSLLAGVVLGPLALPLAPGMTLAIQALHGRILWSRVMIVVCAVALGAARATLAPAPGALDDLERSRAAVGVIVSLPVSGGANERVVLDVQQIEMPDGAVHTVAGRVMLYTSEGMAVSKGDRVRVVWSASAASSAPPGYARFLSAEGVSGSAHVWSLRTVERGPAWARGLARFRREISQGLREALPGDAGALAAGIVTGDDSGLSAEVDDAFHRSGTSHITAVSGQNIGLLLAFGALWMRPARRSTRIASHVAMIGTVWLYALMVGIEAPALRAAIVATLTILGTYTGRRADPLTLLALTLGGMVLLDPRMAQGAGFWLSASASFALCSVMPVDGPPSIGRFLRQSVRAVLAATVATLPFLVWMFGEWSPVSPLANLLIGPLLTVTFPAAYVLAFIALLAPALVPVCAWIPGIGLDTTIVIVRRVGAIMPLVSLEASRQAGSLAIGLACAAMLATMSRDGARWARLVAHRWRADSWAMHALACGALIGIAGAIAIRTLI
ncbi:MAG TPA: ComEC/Rec2 family competence protein [Thermomicrobiales bacterium]|nr:ComEC/Rec2 family competence protein [Thermomicrobiales bacterium]